MGPVYATDVVNEAIARKPNGEMDYRPGPWYPKLPDYIAKAFKYAREADPDTLLFYNDYNLEWGGKWLQFTINFIKKLLREGVPIDGVGFQYHVGVDSSLTREGLAEKIRTFGDMGLQVHITEIDVELCKVG